MRIKLFLIVIIAFCVNMPSLMAQKTDGKRICTYSDTLIDGRDTVVTVSYDYFYDEENGDSEYYADEDTFPIRTDTVPAVISFYGVAFNSDGYLLFVRDGFVVFDVYLVDTVSSKERREFMGALLDCQTPFPEKYKLYDYKLKTEME